MLGAICGDVLGSTYEFEEKKYEDISEIVLCKKDDQFTDDTVLTMAVAEWLLHDCAEKLDDETLKRRLAQKFLYYTRTLYRDYPAGYGGLFMRWLARLELLGEDAPYNSFGNGSAMRVSPVAWMFDSIGEVRRYAKLQADVTHNHPEGEKGAEAVASAIFLARTKHTKDEIRDYIIHHFYPLDKSGAQLRGLYGFDETCQGSVPQALTAFLESNDYESAVRLSISYGGDSDTIACMAGGIAEAYYGGVPETIACHCLDKLTDHGRNLISEFAQRLAL